jgi:hypothetical protein
MEDELRQALRRREPPPGFAERVLARARIRTMQPRRSVWFHWRWLAPVAALLVVVVGLSFFAERRRRLEGERAKQQVMFALQLTGAKLRYAQERVEAVMGTGSAFPH